MENWLDGSVAYWHWLILGLVLLGMEIFLSGFILFWFGVSALVLGILMMILAIPFKVQLFLWAALSLASVLIWNRYVRPGWKDKSLSGMASEALMGQVGTVIQPNGEGRRGTLRFPAPLLGEDEWQFYCEDIVAIGTRVQVIDLSGNALIVRAMG